MLRQDLIFTIALVVVVKYTLLMSNLLTTQQAAIVLGVTDSRVRQLVLSGKLPSEKFGHLNMIREDDLELVKDIKRGRPPNAKPDEATPSKIKRRERD